MKNHGARTGRRTLASTSWLLLLAGLSCKYDVTLPWVPDGADAREPDTSFDQAPSPSPDQALPSPDAPVCPKLNNKPLDLYRGQAQIIVAINRSSSMQDRFDTITKLQAAMAAVNNSVARHPQILFPIIWFPGTNCGPSACCASSGLIRMGSSDAAVGCGSTDAGCQSSSNESPAHRALEQARIRIKRDYWAWNTLVLITDQDPRCTNEPASEQNECNVACDQVDLISDLGVKTFVMVPSAEGRPPACLIRIANQNPSRFADAREPIVAKNPREILDQLNRIASGIEESLCIFYPPQYWVDHGPIEQVKIAGETIQRDDTGETGWRPVDKGIELSGVECKRITENPSPDVKAFTCNSGYGPIGPNGN